MKFLAIICLVLSLATASFAAEARGTFKNSAHPGKCFMNSNLILSPGDEIKNPNIPCGQILCEADSVAVMQTCPVIFIEGYTQGDYIDTSKPYPACCERQLIPK